MPAKYTVPLKIIVKELNLEPLHLSSKYDSTLLSMSEINRRPCSLPVSIITLTRSACRLLAKSRPPIWRRSAMRTA